MGVSSPDTIDALISRHQAHDPANNPKVTHVPQIIFGGSGKGDVSNKLIDLYRQIDDCLLKIEHEDDCPVFS